MSLANRRGTGGVINLLRIGPSGAAHHDIARSDLGRAPLIHPKDVLTLLERVALGQARDIVEDRQADDGYDCKEHLSCRKTLALLGRLIWFPFHFHYPPTGASHRCPPFQAKALTYYS